ncbi:unnamed protein product [Spirodela intermedia]|uniref:Uncharacterized protein n=1 Tax=Spirodela intermedia TaxID=51605 RepID=A0ABN7EB54_SPIIN|nr:unnamed protein product [Spirodela intermedia]
MATKGCSRRVPDDEDQKAEEGQEGADPHQPVGGVQDQLDGGVDGGKDGAGELGEQQAWRRRGACRQATRRRRRRGTSGSRPPDGGSA